MPDSARAKSAADSGVPSAADLRARLAALTIRDEHRLARRLGAAGRGDRVDPRRLAGVQADVARAEARVANRRAAVPALSYPENLPVSQRREDLLAAIADHQVVVVAGETGSGKTTQLPKLCLELGRGVRGMIGHTQPRRIAARSVAERIAEELRAGAGELGGGDADAGAAGRVGAVGDVVGFAVRFTDRVSERTLVKLMTDGILLAEIQRDRMLRGYDTIIIDEAHERSLNVDFLLGYLKQLLPRRPDLKLIITSATIDPQRFADYFEGAPVIEVSGRGYPVDVWYRPVVDPDDPTTADRDQVSAIADAVAELRGQPPGDVLVFLSGEREIRDTADALNALVLPMTEVLPLYGRLSTAEQHRVFAAHRGRRIVLATNVAETSLTVPGIKYVIDAGAARISRYSQRTKVQLLPIEPISQASAKQRAGRCGRTSPGICVRLYSQADYEGRPAFTDPEILRTNLASVILQMAALDLGPIERFGFIDPPDPRQVASGVSLLSELGALAADGNRTRLTDLGRQIAQLPVDPRLARMIVEADRRGCLRDVLVLAAALSIQDPRERPSEHQQAADTAHARFADHTSDFASYLNLWRHIRTRQAELSSSQFRKLCRAEYLNYLRIREWQDLFAQLRQIVKGMGMTVGDQAGDNEQIHRSLLSGLLSHIGSRDAARRDYLGARNARFAIFPGSALAKKQPQFVMAAELVDTSRLWARINAVIQPEWAEELAGPFAKRSYSEPHWERRRGAVVALERVTLYGVPLVVGRKVGYHRIDPALARELFIRHALVEGDWQSRHRFIAHNQAVIAEVRDLENRARRRDLLADDETIFAFYDQRVPDSVVSARHFDSWWKKAGRRRPDLLNLSQDDLVRDAAGQVSAGHYPDRWTSGEFDLDLSYRFEPGAAADGVTVTLPVALLGQADAARLDWQVPGLRAELVTALLRGLPKDIRRLLVPIPDTARSLLAQLPEDLGATNAAITDVLAAGLRRTRGVEIARQHWRPEQLPEHLRPTYRVVDARGRTLAESKDLAELRTRFAAAATAQLRAATADIAREDLTGWDFDALPRAVQRELAGHRVTGYPSLVAAGDGRVGVRVLDSADEQRAAMRAGTRQLLIKVVAPSSKRITKGLGPQQRLTLSRAPHASPAALLADCLAAAVDEIVARHGGPVWDQDGFDRLTREVAAGWQAATEQILAVVTDVVGEAQQVELRLAAATKANSAAASDVASQLHALVYPGFVTDTGAGRLPNLIRYLRAMARRLDDAAVNAGRDRDRQAQVELVLAELARAREQLPRRAEDPLAAVRWMVEELRVSLFAQQLGTAHAVSARRIVTAIDEVLDDYSPDSIAATVPS